MNSTIFRQQLNAAILRHNEIETEVATLALLALANITYIDFPNAAYIVLTETDQNDSGELWVQSLLDSEHEPVHYDGDWDNDPIAYHLHGGNEAVWKLFVTDVSGSGRSAPGEYLLDIQQVLKEVSPPPHMVSMLDLSLRHLPEADRGTLNWYSNVIADRRNNGWLLWVPEDIGERILAAEGESDPIPPAVVDIWRYAAKWNCQYVLLDTDGPVAAELPDY